MKLAIVVSHPIQHFCPQYASFAKIEGIVLRVFFGSALGYKKYYDPNFKKEVVWGNLYLDQFDHVFLNGDQVLASDRHLDSDQLESHLNQFQPDVLITYGYIQKLQRRARRWAIKNTVKVAYISDSELRHRRNKIKEWLKYFFLRNYFSQIDYFLTVGDANEEYYRQYGVNTEKFIRMHFPIDVVNYERKFESRTISRKVVRERLNINEDCITLLVVGKLVTWKNQDHLIDALYALEKKDKSFVLLMAGSGEMMEAWMKKAKNLKKNKVHFLGFVPPEELPDYYAAADIYIHPASIEPHSIAISEAIYMGCPIIVSDRCGSYGVDDDVQETKNGFVFQFGNINDLTSKIFYLTDTSIRNGFGAVSHQLGQQYQSRSHSLSLKDLSLKLYE